jgi:phage antirepressor YoqD-like protein
MNALTVAPTAAPLVTFAAGEPRISSLSIAEHTDTEHSSIVRIIRTDESDLLELGDFPAVSAEKSTGGRPAQHYLLNEAQAALLMSNLRSTDRVRAFRLKMIKAFVAMAQQLRPPALPATYEQALETLLTQVRRNTVLTAQVEHKEAQLAVTQPKAICYDRTMYFGETVSINETAKILGFHPTQLRLFLRTSDWLYKDRNREIPIQHRVNDGHLLLKMSEFGGSARVTPSGVEAISKHIDRLKAALPARYALIFGVAA